MIQILLVDDHDLVRAGLKRILEDVKNIKVIGEASTGEEAIQMVRQRKPDVVIMDVNMPGIGGLETTRKLMQIDHNIKVIVVTVHLEEPYPTRLLEAGAAGYLTKSCAVDERLWLPFRRWSKASAMSVPILPGRLRSRCCPAVNARCSRSSRSARCRSC